MKKSIVARAVATGLAALLATPAVAASGVRITEWLYAGSEGEFVEFTNFGPAAVDFTGWSYDDDSRLPGVFDLSAFGIVNSGESVIITESPADFFRARWNLPDSVKVLGGYTNNLGRNDEINLFDAGSHLVDRLTYGDQTFPGSIRTQNISGQPTTLAALGVNDAYQWEFSVLGRNGVYQSAAGDIGNPGIAPIPEPETYALMLAGLGLVGLMARRRRARNA